MRVIFRRSILHPLFQIAASVAPQKTTKPVLANVRLDVDEGGAAIMANNMEIGVRIEVPVEGIPYSGAVLLPVDRFGPILREVTDQEITIEAYENGLQVRGARCRFDLPIAPVDEFPIVEQLKATVYHEVDPALFCEMIRRTIICTEDSAEARYALAGVHFEFHDNSLVGVSTDGKRLSTMEIPAESVGEHKGPEFQVVVPMRALQVIEKAIGDSRHPVRIAVVGNNIHVSANGVTVSAMLIEGRFPKWREITRNLGPNLVEIVAGELHSAVRQASVMSSKESTGLDFNFDDDVLTLKAATSEKGASQVQVDIEYHGAPSCPTLGHRFVSDFLKVLPQESSVEIRFGDSESKVQLSTTDGSIYFVMPMSNKA